MLLPPFELHAPETVDEAVRLARDLGAGTFDWIAGGTDLLPNYKWQLNARPNVISLHRIVSLRACGPERLGALVRLREIEESVALREALPVLPTTAAMIASPLLRASGTLGGNLCLDTRCYYFNQGFSWRESKGFCLKADGDVCLVVPQKEKCYATFSADLPAPLIALGARVHLAGPDGAREMPLKDFYRGDGIERNVRRPDEIVTFVDLPPSARRLRAAYTKLRLRESWDFPELGIAVALRLDGDRLAECHIVANALETTPRVLDDVAAPHLGKPLTDAAIDRIAADVEDAVQPVKNTSYPPSYRKKMARVYTRRALKRARDGP